MALKDEIADFLAGRPHAVVGASTDRSKYGNKVLRSYMQHGRPVYPVNPRADLVEGLKAYPDLGSIPEKPHGVSIITPPALTLKAIEEAARLGIRRLWLQPGAESPEVLERAAELGLEPIAGGPCLLVVLGFREDDAAAPAPRR
jgi:predicted CoA-binding protein